MLRLQSGFELDYANIYNESCIQERDINNFERAIQNVWRHTNILRSTGFEEGHVSKDGLPETGIVLPTSLYFRRWYQYTCNVETTL